MNKERTTYMVWALVAFLALGAVAFQIGGRYLNEFPAFIHAWAQTDWYAIAVGYVDNGLDFFHPQTALYIKQFPTNWECSSPDTITSVDFPIHPYFVALLMTLFGTTSPWVFRLWTLLLAWAGLMALFILCYQLTRDGLKSLLVAFLGLTSPVFAYYCTGFLPCIPGFAFAAIGLCFYVSYHARGRLWLFHFGVLFLGLAMLIRTTFAIPLIAVLLFEGLRLLRRERPFVFSQLVSIVAVVAVYLGWSVWNSQLRKQHGSLFLDHLVPPQSFSHVRELLEQIHDNWWFAYFNPQVYNFILIIATAAVSYWLVRKVQRDGWDWFSLKRQWTYLCSDKPLSLWILALSYVIGEAFFFVAMMVQYRDHDYYFLDSFFLPVLFCLVLLLAMLPRIPYPTIGGGCIRANTKRWAFVVVVGLLMVSGIIVLDNKSRHKIADRRDINDVAFQCSEHFSGSALLLDSMGISREARILTPWAYPQNGPFLHLRRYGYPLMWYDFEIVQNAFASPYDYMVIEREKCAELFYQVPDIASRMVPLGGNESLLVCRPGADTLWHCADDLLNAPYMKMPE